MIILEIRRTGLGHYCTADIEHAVDELLAHFEGSSNGDQVIFTIREMEQKQFDDLPEFKGW